MNPLPLLFLPILKEKVWGGRYLEKLGKTIPAGVKIGESWELADLPESISGGRSVIAHGEFASLTLREVLGAHQRDIMGRVALSPEGGFPLLIKFLDAQENLSVQVHPDEAYVQRHPDAHLKSEAWYIIHAESGAVIYKGLKRGIDRAAFERMLHAGCAHDALEAVPAVAGECHYLPSGTVHALGAGVVVAEVQTPSDTTFRLYDWGRDSASTGRGLHLEEAMACMRFAPAEREVRPPAVETPGTFTQRVAKTHHFIIEEIRAVPGAELAIAPSSSPEIWMVLRGGGAIHVPGAAAVPMRLGATILIPAAMQDGDISLHTPSIFLRITLPLPQLLS